MHKIALNAFTEEACRMYSFYRQSSVNVYILQSTLGVFINGSDCFRSHTFWVIHDVNLNS